MRYLQGLLAALALALPACGGAPDDRPYETVFDPCEPLVIQAEEPLTDVQREALAQGIAWWNERAGTRLTLAPVEGVPVVPVRFQSAVPFSRGLYDDGVGVIYLNRVITDRHVLAIVTAHEVGHAFDLHHVPAEERVSVMNPGNATETPNAGDVAALVALWGACDGR